MIQQEGVDSGAASVFSILLVTEAPNPALAWTHDQKEWIQKWRGRIREPGGRFVEADGSVTKKTLKEGEGWNRPNEGAKVGVRLAGYLPDGTKFEETPEGELTRWMVDEEQQIAGLDKALMKMKYKSGQTRSAAQSNQVSGRPRQARRALSFTPSAGVLSPLGPAGDDAAGRSDWLASPAKRSDRPVLTVGHRGRPAGEGEGADLDRLSTCLRGT
eukprot:5229131-Pyramimonas_sp.AAC.3